VIQKRIEILVEDDNLVIVAWGKRDGNIIATYPMVEVIAILERAGYIITKKPADTRSVEERLLEAIFGKTRG